MMYTPGDRAPRPPVVDRVFPEDVNTSFPPPVRPYVSSTFPRVVTPRERRSRRTGEPRRRRTAGGPWWWQWLHNRRNR